MKNRFGRGGCFKCDDCGKMTRDTGDNAMIHLCRACMEYGEALNAHSDNDHVHIPVPGCPICGESMKHAN